MLKVNSMRMKWFFWAFSVVVFDQVTKWLCTLYLSAITPIKVLPGFDLILRHNTGAAFSFLAEASGWQRWFFVGLALVIGLMIILWLQRLPENKKLEGMGLSLILGGAIGNVIDRILYGHVVDFIVLYYKEWQWPAFNIADSAICIGVFLFAMSLFKKA